MRNWKKQITAVGLSASLLASGFSAAHAEVKLSSYSKKSLSVSDLTKTKKGKNEQSTKPVFSDDTLVIRYLKPLTAADHQKAGAIVIRSYSQYSYTIVKVKDKKKLEKTMKAYQKMGKVSSVSPSVLYTTASIPDPKTSKQYHLSLLKIAEAQKLAGKKAVKVAVIDQGVDKNHPELKGQVISSYNANDPMNQTMPDFHGTHVSGIIAAKKGNGVGGYGVNPNAKILSYDVFDRSQGASDYNIADAILKAVHDKAKVINMSLAGYAPSPIIEEAVKTAIKNNVTIVAAASNESIDEPAYPASYEGVISVGSTNAKNKLSWYSNYGPTVDLVAPGEDIYAPLYDYEKKSTFEKMSGTSMASPVVAGVASLLLSKHPNLKPEQIEYILEHTAKDLGAKGYDTKYANGLVQPLAALKFNVKKIPASVKPLKTEREILDAAKEISLVKPYAKEGKITRANEEKWVKVYVEKGQYIQTSLKGSKNYDLKLKLNLYGSEGKTLLDVNKLRTSGTEGKLLKAPFSGYLAIGVKDVNGNYDDSSAAKSRYTLSVKKLDKLPKDTNTLEKPATIGRLPFAAKGTFTRDEEEDQDYYNFTVDKTQLIKVKTSGVPGVNTTLNLYAEEPESPDGEGLPEKDMGDEEEYAEPMLYQNSKGYGAGETLVFQAVPGVKYSIGVTNLSDINDGMFDFMMDFSMFETEYPEPSAIPYVIKVEGKVTPEDEDGLPYTDDEESPEQELANKKISVKEYSALKQKERKKLHAKEVVIIEDDSEEDMIEVQDIVDNALAHKLGGNQTGYLQSEMDEDWFTFTAKKDGIYQFNLGKGELPELQVYELYEYEDEDGETGLDLGGIGDNYSDNYDALTNKFVVSVTKGQRYFVRVANNSLTGSSLYDQYSFNSQLLVANPNDTNEPNDVPVKVKDLKNNKATGNFSKPWDYDSFYVKAKETGIYNVSLTKGKVTKELKKKYPSSVLNDYYGLVLLAEDHNGNRQLDDSESDTLRVVYKGIEGSETRGSFKTKKGHGYFVVATGEFYNRPELSMVPYTLKVESVNRKDEDAKSVVKNNKPSKPLTLKKVNSKTYSRMGYFNAIKNTGDADWYKWSLKKTSKVKLSLDISSDIDGVITVFKNGKQVAKGNYYGNGDAEVLYATLGKGTYHIQVKDRYGNASVHAYKLKAEIR